MKKVFLMIGALLLALPVAAQNTATFAGNVNVPSFAYGAQGAGPALQVGGGGSAAGGTYSITLNYGKTTTGSSGLTFYPFAGTNLPPFAIGSGSTYEVVTPSSANCGPGPADSYQQCTLTATFTYAHGAGDVVRASDGGTMEASNYNIGTGHQRVIVSLTNAQILGMFTTPVQVMPAAPAGFFYEVSKATIINENTGTAYASGGAITVGYGTTAATNALGSTIAATFLTSPTSRQVIAESGALNGSVAGTAVVNQPLYITNATGAFTTGTGTLKLVIDYTVVPQ